MPAPAPSRALQAFLWSVDVGFILYWLITIGDVLPPSALYAHHDDPVMVAWNWSFMPLDLLVSATGLSAMVSAKRGDSRWPLLAALSLAATSASGLNAIAFWALRGDFDLGWWAPNLLLMLVPLPLFWQLWRSLRRAV